MLEWERKWKVSHVSQKQQDFPVGRIHYYCVGLGRKKKRILMRLIIPQREAFLVCLHTKANNFSQRRKFWANLFLAFSTTGFAFPRILCCSITTGKSDGDERYLREARFHCTPKQCCFPNASRKFGENAKKRNFLRLISVSLCAAGRRSSSISDNNADKMARIRIFLWKVTHHFLFYKLATPFSEVLCRLRSLSCFSCTTEDTWQ